MDDGEALPRMRSMACRSVRYLKFCLPIDALSVWILDRSDEPMDPDKRLWLA